MNSLAQKKAKGSHPNQYTPIDNRHEKMPARLRLTLSAIWDLNDQEISYLDKHFLLIRTVQDLVDYHLDNHKLNNTLVNGRIVYDVVFQGGISSWADLQADEKIKTSWRFNATNGLAVVLVRRYQQ